MIGVILLDTNALLFLLAAHPRGRALRIHAGNLAISSITLLELAFLTECGRIGPKESDPVVAARTDDRWVIDDPPLEAVVSQAISLAWTRDPFDRLIAGHALARGFRLATSDRNLLAKLPTSCTICV